MIIASFLIPQLVLLGWFWIHRRSANLVAAKHTHEDVMLQHIRDYLQAGYHASSKHALMLLTQKASAGAFQCVRQSLFQPRKGGNWTQGENTLAPEESSLLAAIAAQGLPIDRRAPTAASTLSEAAFHFMDRRGVNVLIPVNDSMSPQWIWASYFPERHTTPEIDPIQAWQMAMQSVAERSSLRVASAHLALLEKDAASATQVLRVLLPESPSDEMEGVEWTGALRRESGEPPVLFATYPQGEGKLLVIFSEVVAPGLAAVILGSALRGYCDSIVAGSKSGTPLRPENIMANLNQYIWRPQQPTNLSCIVALWDTRSGRIDYAVAGEPCWLHVKQSGDVTPITGTGPGLGVLEGVGYLPKRIELEAGDSHLFLGMEHHHLLRERHLQARAQAASHILSGELADYVHDFTELMDTLDPEGGRTPAAVLIRPQSRA